MLAVEFCVLKRESRKWIGTALPALPCGTQLLGTVRKNGAVELAVPAFRW